MTHETKFLAALRDVFVGAPVQGKSGYINLMRIKARYFQEGVFPALVKDIDAALTPFPSFREELFDKLYDFFHRYFSESGSIYFRYTPLHHNLYERVYTEDRDVALFWKTHMLYYVKSERLFHDMTVTVDGVNFAFDVSGLAHKKSNEKRSLMYACAGQRADGGLTLTAAYSERGKTTDLDAIRKQARAAHVAITEDQLEQAIRLFERQSEVDYFINKDARAFLREQFDLWLYQYVFREQTPTQWSERRVAQLQALRTIAFKIIDFVAQFEDELVKVWNKPKFVLDAGYIITLERIARQAGGEALLARILADSVGTADGSMTAQLAEWRALGMVDEGFTVADVWQETLEGKALHLKYAFLPLDTKHFKALEPDLLALFDHLDDELDGWLVHSENYQALNTLLPKWRGKVKVIHIDPPYNTDTSGFLYRNNYQHASWLTMMQNRIEAGLPVLNQSGSFICHIDENEYERLHLLFENWAIPNAGTVAWDKRNPMNAGRGIATQHEYVIWRSYQTTPIYWHNKNAAMMLTKATQTLTKHGGLTDGARKEFAEWVAKNNELSGGDKAYRYLDDKGQVYQSVSLRAPEPRTDPKFFMPLIHPVTDKPCPVPPNGFSRTPETLAAMMAREEILFGPDETTQPRQKVLLKEETQRQVSSVIQDGRKGKADLVGLGLDFPYGHPVGLYEDLVGSVAEANDMVLDFFAGSGTTAHAVINLNREDAGSRKYILVEMGDHFDTVILPRIKKVVFSDAWKDGKAVNGNGKGAARGGITHFAKYYSLEQYEDALSRATYRDADLFHNPYESPYSTYVFLRDTKLLDNAQTGAPVLTLDEGGPTVDVGKLYDGVDVAETLSCATGQRIRRLLRDTDEVEFEDGSRASLVSPPWELIRPLIWW